MTNKIIPSAARIKRAGSALRNAPLFALATVVTLSVEAFAWAGILSENMAVVELPWVTINLGFAEVAMSTAFSLAALVLAGAAAAQKADPRREQQRRAWATQLLAVLVLIAPVYYAGNCLALQRQLAEWRQYSGSDQHQADLRDSQDMMLDSMMRRESADRLGKAAKPERAEFDFGSTLWIALLLGCNMLAVRLGWRARPETPAEAKAREKAMAVTKGRITRERNKRQRENDLTNVQPIRSRG